MDKTVLALLTLVVLCIGIDAKTCSEHLAELQSQPPRLGAFKPKCQPNGKYEETQCHGSTGYCYCVFPDTGEKVLGTEVRFTRPKTCKLTECMKARHQMLSKPKLLGQVKPVCKDDGSFEPIQCHGSTGYCYCVFPDTGKKVLGTEVRFTRPKTCKLTDCFVKRHAALVKSSKQMMVGVFQPQCSDDGKYAPTQCYGSTGYCYCVFPDTGEKVLGTEVRFTRPKTCELTECVKARHQMLSKPKLLGQFKPVCKDDGSFESIQCHERDCYCVFPDSGKEIMGTRVQSGRPKSCRLTPCVQKRHDVLSSPRPLLGAFKPECNDDGSYKPVQCHENFCYCVFNNGEEVLGTMVKYSRPKSCKLTPCVLSRHKGWKMAKFGLLGVPISRCDEYGKYQKVQCRKGYCWCVDPDTGKGIDNSGKIVYSSWQMPSCD